MHTYFARVRGVLEQKTAKATENVRENELYAQFRYNGVVVWWVLVLYSTF